MGEYRARGNHHHLGASSSNNKHAELINAYQELGRELGSEKLTIVGGYTLGRVIGEGTYGSVHLAIHRLTGTRCAIKKIPKSQTPSLTREIHHHRRLHHPSIVQLYEIIATESHIWLVFELCSGGELFDYLVEKKRFQEGEARRLFGELVVAVGYLHRQGVVHRDLKLENVLLDGHLRVKLGDLGFAREFRRGQLMDTFCGTMGYASPEMLAGRKYLGVETDIWSLGIILYTLLCGGMPFDEDDEPAMRAQITKGEYEEPDWISEESKQLIRSLLKTDPSERLTIEGILSHPWFKMTIRDHPDTADTPMDPAPIPVSPLGLPIVSSSAKPSPFVPPHVASRPALSPSPLGSSQTVNPPGPSSDCSDNSQDFTDSEQGQPPSDSTAPTTIDDDDLAKSLPRNHSIEFSPTEHLLELLHPNASQSTLRRSGSDGTVSASTLKSKVAMRTALEGQPEEDEDSLTEDHLGTLAPSSPYLTALTHSRTPSRTKRRSVSSSLTMERRASYISNSGDFDIQPLIDYASQLKRERSAVFSTAPEKALLESFRLIGLDAEQMQHSVKNNACDASAAMWWIVRTKTSDSFIDVSRQTDSKAENRRRASPDRSGGEHSDAQEVRSLSDQEKHARQNAPKNVTDQEKHARGDETTKNRSPDRSGKTSPPIDASQTSPTKTPTSTPSSPFRKARSPSLSMLQRATSAFTGKRNEDKDESEDGTPKADTWNGSPSKLQKAPPRVKRPEIDSAATPLVPLNSPINGIGQSSSASFKTGSLRQERVKRDSLWAAFRYFFNEDKRRRRDVTGGHAKIGSETSASATVVLSRGPVARHHAGPVRTPQPLPAHKRTSIDGRPPLYSRRSSSVNSRRSSITSTMVPPDHREVINTLARRVSHQSHGSQTPTSEHEIEFPTRVDSATSLVLRHQSSSIRSPSMQSETSGRFLGSAPASPLHDYHRRAPAGSSSTRVRHFRVIPEATIQRTSSVASSVRSTASSRTSSIDKGWQGSGGDETSVSSKRAKDRKRASPKPRTRVMRTTNSKPPLRDVFEDKDEEWVDEDEYGNERRAFAGGVGQGGHTVVKNSDVRAATHPGNWSAGHHRRKHHKHGQPRSRRGSTDEATVSQEQTTTKARNFAETNVAYRRVGLPVASSRQPVVMEEDEGEE